ncbi:hypothetical protein DM860_001551 [Cuscuta australis]|uniref:Protein RALF-like 24 n=1 Tax=Cuscuta australis TaxID=267555 RepID=A0A328ECV7_9ASTE|nr:hypothetical protein DM860_001551 [Cuscuta australis]
MMGMLKPIFLALLFLNSRSRICHGASEIGPNPAKAGNFDEMAKRVCSKTRGECPAVAAEEEEEEMDSLSSRRVLLMHKKYISYETLRRDMVPCDTPGASYYLCKVPAKPNSYHRGCEIITRCARQINGINS